MSPRKLVILQGCPRSGTTLLNRILNTHPNILITNELDLVNIYNKIDMTFFQKSEKYKKNATWRKLSPGEDNFIQALGEYYPCDRGILPGVIETLCVSSNSKKEILIYGDKTPTYYQYKTSDLIKLCKDETLHIIHVTRNPDDVLRSIKWRTQNALKGNDTWKSVLTSRDAINHWKYAWNSRINLHKSEDVKFLDLNYDALVQNPNKSLLEVSKFLDIPMLFNNSLIKVKSNHDPSKNYDLSSLWEYDFNSIIHDDYRTKFSLSRDNIFNKIERKIKRIIIEKRLRLKTKGGAK